MVVVVVVVVVVSVAPAGGPAGKAPYDVVRVITTVRRPKGPAAGPTLRPPTSTGMRTVVTPDS